MRIRLRVPTDGEVKSDGFRGWWQRLCDSFKTPSASVRHPRLSMCQIDKRWSARGGAKYFFEGRRCRNIEGAWQTEYVFSVFAGNELQQIRVVLPEGPIAAWEQEHDQRMSEDERLRLARETMVALVDLNRYPAAITVPADTIAAVQAG